MMVQNAPDGAAHFISTMAEHNDLCGQFARAFGNDEFEPIDPYEEMLYAVSHHDRGWETWDSNPGLDPKLNLPAGLGGTPPPKGVEANRLSPEFNERHHAYCGLLVSMHSWGLFNARYGFSEFRVRPGNVVECLQGVARVAKVFEFAQRLLGKLERLAHVAPLAVRVCDVGER